MRAEVLDYPVDPLDAEAAVRRVAEAVESGAPLQVVTLNAEMAMQGQSNAELAAVLKGAGLVLPDGSGVVWALRRQGVPVRKLAGVDFLGHVAAWAAREGRRIYLLGAAPGVAREAAQALEARYPGLAIAGVRDGYFKADEEPGVREAIREARPDVLLVALGVPRQETWIARHQQALGVPVAMGVGGSFDVLAGKVKRAPGVFQRLHAEWLFRLIQEPWRWRRMASTLPRFAVLVWRHKGGST